MKGFSGSAGVSDGVTIEGVPCTLKFDCMHRRSTWCQKSAARPAAKQRHHGNQALIRLPGAWTPRKKPPGQNLFQNFRIFSFAGAGSDL